MSVTMQGLPDAVRWQTIKDFTGVYNVPASGVVQKSRGVFTLFYRSEQEAAAAAAALDKKPFWTTQVRVTGSEIEAELKQAVLCPGSAGLGGDESM